MARSARAWLIGLVTLVLCVGAGGTTATARSAAPAAESPGHHRSSLPGPVGPWVPRDSSSTNALWEGQGLATVTRPGGGTSIWYTGVASVPLWLRLSGWGHVGDPDAHGGYVAEPYQADSGTSKMFRIWTPDKKATEYYHELVPGESKDNNFAAISPDGHWLVSGQWGPIRTLPVYPMPVFNPQAPGPDENLPLTGYIRLDHAIANIQGCDFTSSTQLLCSSDAERSPMGNTKPLVQIDLAEPFSGRDVTGHVTELGELPLESVCSGTFETEGLDYESATGNLRVEMIPPLPCAAIGTVWRFKRSAVLPEPDGVYMLVNAATGLSVDSPGFAPEPATPLVTWSANYGANQRWRLVDTGDGDGYRQLRLVSNDQCLDISGASEQPGALALQYPCDANGRNQANQLWRLQRDPDGSYTVMPKHTGMALTPQDAEEGSTLTQSPDTGGKHQRWWLVSVAG